MYYNLSKRFQLQKKLRHHSFVNKTKLFYLNKSTVNKSQPSEVLI